MARLIDADELKKNFQDELCKGIACAECSMQVEGFCRVERWIDIAPTIEAEPIKLMCNGAYINCPAHKDYERGYKDGQAEAQMKAEPVKHGKWIYRERMPFGVNVFAVDCSKCGYHTVTDGLSHKYNYCPNCGARMDLEEVKE